MWRLLDAAGTPGYEHTFLTIMYTSKLSIKHNYIQKNRDNVTSLTKTVDKVIFLKLKMANGKLSVFCSFPRLLGLPLELQLNIKLQITYKQYL